MKEIIKKIEDLSLNAWPSHKMELYDGWILRFSYMYTHRTNSVEQFGESIIPLREKIPYCEKEYERLGSPAIFKISPMVSDDFDYILENRGYGIEHVTNVMTLTLVEEENIGTEEANGYPIPSYVTERGDENPEKETCLQVPVEETPGVFVYEEIPDEWIQALFRMKRMTDPRHLEVVPSMYRAIPKKTVCVCIRKSGRIVATGLGILDRDYIGIYAIHVDAEYRRRGYAKRICQALLREGIRRGARNAYLQVVEGNQSAYDLYESLGFSRLYTYWFRVQPGGAHIMEDIR